MASPEEMAQSMIDNMPEKTGRDLQAWLKLARTAPEQKHGKIVAWLKSEHGMTHGYANLVAHKHLAGDKPGAEDEDPVDAIYSGKEHLRPIHDRLCELVRGFGDDAELAPKKAYVSVRRSKQFALIQPSTKTRVDLGLNMRAVEPVGRLEPSGSFNAMVSHRIRLESVDDVDDQVRDWLKIAYELG